MDKKEEYNFGKLNSFAFNLGQLLGQLSDEEIVDALTQKGMSEKEIGQITNNIIELSTIF